MSQPSQTGSDIILEMKALRLKVQNLELKLEDLNIRLKDLDQHYDETMVALNRLVFGLRKALNGKT